MSDDETPRGKNSHASSRNGEREKERPKKKSKEKSKGKSTSKRAKTPECKQPFTESDEFSNVTIKAGDKTFYSNDCLLSYYSPVLREQLKPDTSGGGGKGKGKQSTSADKELDWSDKKTADVINLLEVIDPRVDSDFTEEDAIRVAPLAKEFQMTSLLKACERTLTHSYHERRRARRMTIEDTLKYLEIADSNRFQDLSRMCIDSCIASTNPYVNKSITSCPGITDETKIHILEKKLERANMRKSSRIGLETER